MIDLSYACRAGATAFLVFCAGALCAQTAPATTRAVASADEKIELTPFEVRTERDRGYAASNAVSGTRTNTPIAEIPFNIQVVTEELLSDLYARQPTDALNYFGAVSTRPFDSAEALQGTVDLFGRARIRGLDSSVNLRNGVRSFDQPLSHIVARVELVKGPAAVLYGLSEPGGVYNSITKTPLFDRAFTRGSVSAGTYDNYRSTIDFNRPLNKQLAFRLNAVWQQIGTEHDFSDGQETAITPQLTWKPFSKTQLMVEYEYDDRERGNPEGHRYRFANSSPSTTAAVTIAGVTYPSGGLGPLYGTTVRGAQISLYDHPLYRSIAPTRDFSGPDSRRYVERNTLTLNFTQNIVEGLDVQVQGYVSVREHTDDLQQAGLVSGTTGFRYPTPVFLNRWQRFDNRNAVDSLVINAVYKRDFERLLGGVKNTLNFGYQSFRDHARRRESIDQTDRRVRVNGVPSDDPVLSKGRWEAPPQFNRPPPGLWFNYVEILNPGALTRPSDLVMNLLPPAAGSFNAPFDSAYQRNFFTSYFASASSKFFNDRLILNGGIYNTSIDFRRSADPNKIDTVVFDDGDTLPQFGAIFRVTPGLGVFALSTESLQPNSSQRDFAGNPFPPRKGEGREAGLKIDLLGGKISGTVSYFEISQTNRVVFDDTAPNPFDPVDGRGANVARGENTSKGFDADFIFSPTRSLQIMLSYANLDVYTSKDPNRALLGTNEIGSYEHGFGGLVHYQFLEGTLKGLGVGAGANYQGETIAEAPQAALGNIQRTFKGQWDGDVFIKYATKLFDRKVTFQVNAKNLFERERPVGWNPRSANAANIAVTPYYYKTNRKFYLSASFDL